MNWKPISEAPKDGTFVDIWDDGGRCPNARWNEDRWVYLDEHGCWEMAVSPTHFMIIEPPKEGV